MWHLLVILRGQLQHWLHMHDAMLPYGKVTAAGWQVTQVTYGIGM